MPVQSTNMLSKNNLFLFLQAIFYCFRINMLIKNILLGFRSFFPKIHLIINYFHQSKIKSISSENRSITWYDLERLVPPLNIKAFFYLQSWNK